MALLSVGIILFNSIALFTFLFIEYNLGTMYTPKDYPAVSVNHYIKNFWREFYYVLGKYYLLPFKWLNLSIKSQGQDTTAILLVHGYCRHQADWLWLRKQFKDTQCPIFTVNLRPNFASIATITKNSLPKKIAAIKKLKNCDNIILIGHSMGGIVASYYSEYLDKAGLIKAVVTIGSPLQGTKVSVSGAGKNAREMCPNTEFLQELSARMLKTPHKYYHILSRFDNLIFPWSSAALNSTPAAQQLILPVAGHLEMLHSKEVAAQLNTWVKLIIQ